MRRTGDALPKGSGEASVVILGPDDGLVLGDQAAREFVVTVLALVGETFVEPGRQMFSATALCLRKSMCGLAEFMRVRHLCARGEREESLKAWINAYVAISGMRNGLGWCVDEQTEIPARRPLDDPATFETSCRKVLGMEPDMADAWNVDACLVWRLERIRGRKARQFVALAFEPWLLGQFFIAPLPGRIRHGKHPLQGVTGDAELFPMIGKEIMKGLWCGVDAVFGILLDLAYSPIPDASELEEPGMELPFLGGIETQFELPLDHL